MKKLITFIVMVTLVMSMSVAGVSAKAKKPAKVTGLKAVAQNKQITLTWKKAKRAKTYQVYQLKNKKYVKIKTMKLRKTVISNLKQDTIYKFKVRGIKGKKKGKFSKVVTVRTKKPIVHSGKIDPSKKQDNLIVGDTYTFNNLATPVKVTVDRFINDSDGYIVEGKTENGGHYFYSKNSFGYSTFFEEKDYKKHFETDWEDGDLTDEAYVYICKDNDTKAYWTLDGAEPKIGQEDLTGYSEWCLQDYSQPGLENWTVEDAYGGALMKYDPIENPNEKYTVLIKTKLRGTAGKGRTTIWKEPHQSLRMNKWVRAYHGNKLIYETHDFCNRPMPWNTTFD